MIIGCAGFEIIANRPSSQIFLLYVVQDMVFSFFVSALEVLEGSLIREHRSDKIINK